MAESLKQWAIILLLTPVNLSSCDIAAEIIDASVVSEDVGRVDFSNSLLRPEKSRAVNCITIE